MLCRFNNLRFRGAIFGAIAVCAVLCDAPTQGQCDPYQIIYFSESHNVRIQSFAGCGPQFPTGPLTAPNGVPFEIPEGSGNNAWSAAHAGGANPRTLDVPIGQSGVATVHTMMVTIWGQAGPNSYASLEFFGDLGAYHIMYLIGNDDIRDHKEGDWTNEINGQTTINVITICEGQGTDEVRLDTQRIDLPADFQSQELTHMLVSDWGGQEFQRVVLVGLTLECQMDPCPADLNDDGKVNIDDLFQILGAWGACQDCPEDLNDDGKVNIDDLFAILGEWGPCP